MSTRVYEFGAKQPTTHAETAREHFLLANRYRNDLCALERRRRERVEVAMQRHFPEIATLTAQARTLDAQIESLRGDIRKKNAAARRRSVSADDKKKAEELREERKRIYAQLKAARAAAFGPDELKVARSALGKLRERLKKETRKKDVSRHPQFLAAMKQVQSIESVWFSQVPHARAFREALDRIEREHNQEHKTLRAKCGIHAGTYLAIEQAAEKFRAGAPPRFKAYRGDGKIGVQLPSNKPNTVDALIGADIGQFALDGYEPGKKHAIARIRIGTDDDGAPMWCAVPTLFHRDIPDDAKIKWAYLHRRRIGTHFQHRLQLTLERDDHRWEKPNLADRGVVAIDVGWRLVAGGLRVAYWLGNDGREGEIVLPEKLVRAFRRCDAIRSDRDQCFNRILPAVSEYVRALIDRGRCPQWMIQRTHKTGEDGVTRFTLPLWRSSAKLAALIIQWRTNRIAGDDHIFGRAEMWRRQDKHDLNRQEHGRHKAIGWRNEIYRTFAARLRTEYCTVIVEKINWREMQQTPDAERDDKDRLVGEFRIAAVGGLVETLAQNMRETVWRDAKHTTMTCPHCGELSGEANPQQLVHTCGQCGKSYDQDRAAAINLLDSHCPKSLV